MKVMILGAGGYLGWPTCMYFSDHHHDVIAIDCGIKQQWEEEVGSEPHNPPKSLNYRVQMWNRDASANYPIIYEHCNIATDDRLLYKLIDSYRPHCIIHYAEQPSAPYSMISRSHAVTTQVNNIVGTLNVIHAVASTNPDCHIIKLGTMGEYGTPNIPIKEGWLDLEIDGRKDRVLYPKKPGSFYHLSKVHDSHNLEFVCRIWNLRVTDLNQGIVYGYGTKQCGYASDYRTTFHYDAVFGTVLNRFIAQAVLESPITVYGSGNQTRGYLNIEDTMKCVEIAAKNCPEPGEFRVFNQFTETFSVLDLANLVRDTLGGIIIHIDNPRVEEEEHFFEADHSNLLELGLTPVRLSTLIISKIANKLNTYHIDKTTYKALNPTIKWRQ